MPRNLFEHEMSDLKGSLVDLGHLIDTIIADTLQMLRQPKSGKPPPQSHGGKKP